ncbi:MAG: TRZ/ATZ family hydrolase, partial [Gammaproteobacteria bacterium]|nr:TRZ/ATZ family hydrolase [Gammaproteobacteria bacterium]
MSTINTNFIVSPRWILPVIPRNSLLENHSLVVIENKIAHILPTANIPEKYPELTHLELPNQLLLPGLVNTHGHAAMALLRGYADDFELKTWLAEHIWPVENRLVDFDFVYDGTALAIAEMVCSGTTTVADSYFFPDASAKAYIDHGFRAQVGLPIIHFPNAWANTEEEHINKGLGVRDTLKNQKLITPALAPHAPYSVTNAGFEQVRMYAEQLEMPIHLHLHETAAEVSDAIAETSKRPIQRMKELGILSPSLQAVHMTQITPQEMGELSQRQTHIAHCPASNLKLASGFCPVSDLMSHHVNVALGTDGAASNNNLDMIEEMKIAALMAKGMTGDASSLPVHQVIEMATINGAKFLGLEDKIGSLEPGKCADMISVDLSALKFQPMHNPASALLYAASGDQVCHVWIDGEHQLSNRTLTNMDTARMRANA